MINNKLFGTIFLLFLCTNTYAATPDRNSDAFKQTIEAAQLINTEHFARAINGGNSGYYNFINSPISVDTIIGDWKKNAIGAHTKYTSNKTIIEFTLENIELGARNIPVLTTSSPRKLLPDIIKFEFQKTTTNELKYLGNLQKGAKIFVACEGRIDTLGNPGGPDQPGLAGSILTFKSCQTLFSDFQQMENYFKTGIQAWASGSVTEQLTQTGGYSGIITYISWGREIVEIVEPQCRSFIAHRDDSTPSNCKKQIDIYRNQSMPEALEKANEFMTTYEPEVKS